MKNHETPMNSNIEIPEFDDATLAACTPAELIDIMIEHEDRVPRQVIDACVRRGEQMLEVLTPIAQPNDELEAENIGYWWLRLHAVMILGLIPGERAGLMLVEFVLGMSREEDGDLQDWLAGYWPALLHNKPESVVLPLRDICMDKKADWYLRANMMEAVIEQAQQHGEVALEQILDWAAQLVRDEEEDWDYRSSIASDLLDFPRDRHRASITKLAAQQRGFIVHFDGKDIDKAYARGTDDPKWAKGFSDPWQFYNTEKIERRQRRWQGEEQSEFDLDSNTLDVMGSGFGYHYQEPYQRETQKIGRNDPCPCGSDKKYKKCCLYKKQIV